MNKGDAGKVYLVVKVDGSYLPAPAQATFSNIEITFNSEIKYPDKSVQKSYADKTVLYDATKTIGEHTGFYYVFLTQEDTYSMLVGDNSWQIRIKIGEDVISNTLGTFTLGGVNSEDIL